jgi:hypothetical protein
MSVSIVYATSVMLQTQFNKMENLVTKDDIIIRVFTRESACIVIIGITVRQGAVTLEVSG